MNTLGVHQDLRLNGQVVLGADFTASQQPIDPLALAVGQGDQVLLTCAYINSTGAPVTWGSSYSSEVCYLGLYRYSLAPTTLGDSFECMSH